MAAPSQSPESSVAELDALLAAFGPRIEGPTAQTIDRLRADLAAIAFHLRWPDDATPLVAVLGGTGTGKSTLVNRLLGAEVSATSYRRTFTNGPLAAAGKPSAIADGWLGVEHQVGAELPSRGRPGVVTVVQVDRPLAQRLTLVDTPDLDGDQLLHQAEADRVFRWAQGVIFVVTPEKYQMTELLPYYRLAQRYGVPALFVMNKCDGQGVIDDYRAQLARRQLSPGTVYAIARNDAAWEPSPQQDLAALGAALGDLAEPANARRRREGVANRIADVLDRLRDQVLAPLREDRQRLDQLLPAIRALQTPPTGVDVSPLTEQLQRRMQEQSVLYLIGPHRAVQRLRQVPGMVLRLPKTVWGVLRGRGLQFPPVPSAAAPSAVPDFASILTDQFTIAQSRIDDLVRSSPTAHRWLSAGEDGYRAARIDPKRAGLIAGEEMAQLKSWLQQHWGKTPRDTLWLQKLLHYLPGGRKLVEWSEAAPYLLAIVVATHHAFLGPIDLLVLGGFSLATWLGEKLSNEVTAHTRRANRRIAWRFDQLVGEQVDRVCQWLAARAPSRQAIDQLEAAADRMAQAARQDTEAKA
jgi:energy-coupling factor transporter ATP-binding protein EcfA2